MHQRKLIMHDRRILSLRGEDGLLNCFVEAEQKNSELKTKLKKALALVLTKTTDTGKEAKDLSKQSDNALRTKSFEESKRARIELFEELKKAQEEYKILFDRSKDEEEAISLMKKQDNRMEGIMDRIGKLHQEVLQLCMPTRSQHSLQDIQRALLEQKEGDEVKVLFIGTDQVLATSGKDVVNALKEEGQPRREGSFKGLVEKQEGRQGYMIGDL